jgi:hypothetical protein
MLSLAASVFKELSLLAPDSNDHVVNRIYANTLFTKVSEHAFAGSRNNRVSAMVRDDIDHETFMTLLEFIYSGTCAISSIEMANTIQHIIAGSSLFHLQHVCKNVAAGNPQANATIFRLTQQHVIQHLATLHSKARKVYSDVTLVLDNKHVTAHRAILAARSGYFRDLFMKNPEQSRVELTDTSPAAFGCLLEFIYTGKCSSLNASIAGEVLTAAQLFRTEHVLVQLCESALVKSELRAGQLLTLAIYSQCHSPHSIFRSRRQHQRTCRDCRADYPHRAGQQSGTTAGVLRVVRGHALGGLQRRAAAHFGAERRVQEQTGAASVPAKKHARQRRQEPLLRRVLIWRRYALLLICTVCRHCWQFNLKVCKFPHFTL